MYVIWINKQIPYDGENYQKQKNSQDDTTIH